MGWPAKCDVFTERHRTWIAKRIAEKTQEGKLEIDRLWEPHTGSMWDENETRKMLTPPPRDPELEATLGDITTEVVDAIVNAANTSLLGGGGVDGAIHKAAGPELKEFCKSLGGRAVGDAKCTPGFDLQARWVIHTVGPQWQGGDQGEPDQLASCYRECLARADDVEAKSIAFPAISAGIYGYPIQLSAAIAVKTIQTTPTNVRLVRFIAFNKTTFDVYKKLLG